MKKKYALLTPMLALAGMTFATAGSEKDVALPPPPAPSCVWTLGAEALYLKADSDRTSGYEDQDYELGYRLSLAYQQSGNWGYRLRFLSFDGTNHNYDGGSASSGSNNSDEDGPEVRSIDLEAFNNFALGPFNGVYSVGLRHFDIYETYGTNSIDVDYQGWGPTVSVELTRDINDALSFYVNGRVSYVFGDNDENDTSIDTFLYEFGVGVQYTFALGNCDSYVRLGYEHHCWTDLAYDEQDGGASGAVLGFGFRF